MEHSDFAALCTKADGARACLIAFDLLILDGEDLRQRPLEEKRDRLARLVAEGAIVFAHACKLGLEGIVSKRTSSRYWNGRSRSG